MKVFLSLVHMVIAIALMAVVLLQHRKSGGFSGVFGGGPQADAAVGQWQRVTLLTKVTVVLTALFMVTAVILAILH